MTRKLAILTCCLIAFAVAPRIARADAVDAIFVESGKSAANPAGKATQVKPEAAKNVVAEAAPTSQNVGVTALNAAIEPLPQPLNGAAEAPFTAVPEPSAIILALAALGYFLLFARRRRI